MYSSFTLERKISLISLFLLSLANSKELKKKETEVRQLSASTNENDVTGNNLKIQMKISYD